jgi:hypothetical protein
VSEQPPPLPEYEVFALKYATRPAMRAANFIGGDAHDGPMPLDYYARLVALAQSEAHVIPGHDPLVMARYPAASPELAGIVARLDVAPHC